MSCSGHSEDSQVVFIGGEEEVAGHFLKHLISDSLKGNSTNNSVELNNKYTNKVLFV